MPVIVLWLGFKRFWGALKILLGRKNPVSSIGTLS